MKLSSVDELLGKIQEDKKSSGSYQRYPIRYLFVPNFSILREVVERLSGIEISVEELSNHLYYDDAWLNDEMVTNIITKLDKTRDYIILGISELVRFYKKNEFFSLLMTLSEIENEDKKRRIYIPFIGLHNEMIQNFHKKFHRKKEVDVIWNLETTISPFKIYITNCELVKDEDKRVIDSTKEWLNFWKKGNIEYADHAIACSDTLNFLYKDLIPDNVFIIDKVDNLKEYFDKVKNIKLPIEYKEDEKIFWLKLNEVICKQNQTFSELMSEIFNVIDINRLNIIRAWFESSEKYKKWLLKSYILYRHQLDSIPPYLCKVMEKVNEFDDLEFLKLIWFEIFSQKNVVKHWFKERLDLVKQMIEFINAEKLNTLVENKTEQELELIEDFDYKLNLITGITPYEKQILIKMYNSRTVDYDVLEEKYPELYYYLQDTRFDLEDNDDNRFIIDYFKEYKASKLRDDISDELQMILNDKNQCSDNFYRWYHSFEHVEDILNKEIVDEVIVVDALGLEWVSLINKIINELGLNVTKNYIGVSYLPSTTEVNKNNIKKDRWIYDLDSLVHNEERIFKNPKSIVKEIEKICNIIKNNIHVGQGKRIAIVGDHGLSVFPRLFNKKYDFSDSEHEGRCMKVKQEHIDNEDYCKYKDSNGDTWIVCLKHTSLYKKPLGETHGGATPEEVLVPVIIVTNEVESDILQKNQEERNDYKINFDTFNVDRFNPVLYFTVEPFQGERIIVLDENNNELIPQYDSSLQKWWLNLDSIQIKTMRVIIDDYEESFGIEWKKGMKEDDLF